MLCCPSPEQQRVCQRHHGQAPSSDESIRCSAPQGRSLLLCVQVEVVSADLRGQGVGGGQGKGQGGVKGKDGGR